MLMMDNAKAFDRLQHAFMMDVLQAFNLPTDIINAVRTLYNGAETRVKLNGQLGGPFPNTSGIKQDTASREPSRRHEGPAKRSPAQHPPEQPGPHHPQPHHGAGPAAAKAGRVQA